MAVTFWCQFFNRKAMICEVVTNPKIEPNVKLQQTHVGPTRSLMRHATQMMLTEKSIFYIQTSH